MSRRIGEYLRKNVLGLVAIFIALNAGAYAATVAPPNSVVSTSIKDGQVKTPDLGAAAVTAPKLANRAVASAKLKALSVTHPKLGVNAVGPANVADNSLTGSDINESTLGAVPNATSATSATSATNADQLDNLDSTSFLGANAAAGGSLSGNYPNPTIANGAVDANQLANNAIPADGGGFNGSTKLASNSVSNDEIALNSITNGMIIDGAVFAEDLSASAAGASGTVDTTGGLTRSRNVTSVLHTGGSGIYCIQPAAGIEPTTAVLIATPDFATDGTVASSANFAHVEWRSNPSDCAAGKMEVITFLFNGENPGDNTGNSMTLADQPFSFSIRPSP
jgi:hypothetical protein